MASADIHEGAREVTTHLPFHTKYECTIQGKVDAGAMETFMPSSLLKHINVSNKEVKPSKARVRGATGTQIQTMGELQLKATCDGITKTIRLIVTNLGSELLLGVDFCRAFKLVTIANCCEQRQVSLDANAVYITNETEVNCTS